MPRFNPLTSIAGRLAVATFVALVLVAFIGFVLGNLQAPPEGRREGGRMIVERLSAAVRVIDSQPLVQRPQLARALGDREFLLIAVSPPRPCLTNAEPPPFADELLQSLPRADISICMLGPGAGMPPMARGGEGERPPGPPPEGGFGGPRGDRPPPPPPDGMRPHGSPQGPPGADGRPPRNDHWLQLILSDDSALILRLPPQRERGQEFFGGLPVPAVSTILVSLVIAALVAWILPMTTGSFENFARAAERFGVDAAAPPMKEEGPAEVQTAIKAFNAMQARLQRFIQDRTQMIAAISHDLRTPITRLRLRAEFLDDTESQEAINRDLDDMESMVMSTLEFARSEQDPEASGPLDLASILKRLVESRASVGQPAHYQGPDQFPGVGRPVALSRVFANLIDNAIKYGDEALVTLTGTGGDAVIRVEDRGPGIPPGERERVFRPFYRLESSRSRETGGVGLGLSVARGLILSHGGDIEFADRSGGGLAVVVRLPLKGH